MGAVAGTVVLSVPHFFPEGKRGANRVRDFIAGNKALRIKVFAGGNEASLVDGAVATTRRFALTGIVLGNGGHFIAAVPTGSGVRILDDLEASVSTLTLEEALAAYDKYYPSLLVYSEVSSRLNVPAFLEFGSVCSYIADQGCSARVSPLARTRSPANPGGASISARSRGLTASDGGPSCSSAPTAARFGCARRPHG